MNDKSLLSFKVTDLKLIADQLINSKDSTLYFIRDAIIEGKPVKYGCETKTIYRFLRICEDQLLDKDVCYSINAQDFVSFIKDADNDYYVMIRYNAPYTDLSLENLFSDVIRKKLLTVIDTSYEIKQVYDIMYGNKITLAATLSLSTKTKQRFIDTMKLAPKPSRADLSVEAEITYCPSTGFVMWTNNHICVTSRKTDKQKAKDSFSGNMYVIPPRCLDYMLTHDTSEITFLRKTEKSIECLYTTGDGWYEIGKFYEDARQTTYAKCFDNWDTMKTNKVMLDSKGKIQFRSFLKCVKDTYTKGTRTIKPVCFHIDETSLKVRGGQSKFIESEITPIKASLLNHDGAGADTYDEQYLTKIIKLFPASVSLEFPEQGVYEPMIFRSYEQSDGYTTVCHLSPLQI